MTLESKLAVSLMKLLSPASFYCVESLPSDCVVFLSSEFLKPVAMLSTSSRLRYLIEITQGGGFLELLELALSFFLVSHLDNFTEVTLVRFPAVEQQLKKSNNHFQGYLNSQCCFLACRESA